jgi:hypothetical protein
LASQVYPAFPLLRSSILLTLCTVATAFFQARKQDVSPFFPARLLTQLLNQSRSPNPDNRSKSVTLFTSLVQSTFDATALRKTIDEVSSPLRLGKSASSDHRIALFSMLAAVPPSLADSTVLVGLAFTVLSKEPNEAVTPSIFRVVSSHLPILLVSGVEVEASHIATLVKSLQDTKSAVTRRAASGALGNVLWTLDEEEIKINEAISKLAKALIPALEVNLKNVSSNPLSSPAGPLEGYVAVSLLKGAFQRWQIVDLGTSTV